MRRKRWAQRTYGWLSSRAWWLRPTCTLCHAQGQGRKEEAEELHGDFCCYFFFFLLTSSAFRISELHTGKSIKRCLSCVIGDLETVCLLLRDRNSFRVGDAVYIFPHSGSTLPCLHDWATCPHSRNNIIHRCRCSNLITLPGTILPSGKSNKFTSSPVISLLVTAIEKIEMNWSAGTQIPVSALHIRTFGMLMIRLASVKNR